MTTLVLLLACSGGSDEPKVERDNPPIEDLGPPPEHQAALAQAEAAAKGLGKALKTHLVKAIEESGPAGGLKACSEDAVGLTALVAGTQGAKVGRASLRKRNPNNDGPDWVQAWLQGQGERPAEGVTGLHEIVDGTARFLAPVAIEPPCLLCHGETLADDVQAELAQRYPDDAATGYQLGDLRGAIWAEVKVAAAATE